jgi:hypothetical protein
MDTKPDRARFHSPPASIGPRGSDIHAATSQALSTSTISPILMCFFCHFFSFSLSLVIHSVNCCNCSKMLSSSKGAQRWPTRKRRKGFWQHSGAAKLPPVLANLKPIPTAFRPKPLTTWQRNGRADIAIPAALHGLMQPSRHGEIGSYDGQQM